MKKLVLSLITIISLTIIIVLISFIFYKSKNGLIICTYKVQNDIYEINNIYKINYKEGFVTNLHTKEQTKAADEKLLLDSKISLELMYSNYNKLENYQNTVTLKDNILTSETKINYQKLNVKDFINIDKNNKRLFTKDNKVKVSTLKKMYKDNGARCTYK